MWYCRCSGSTSSRSNFRRRTSRSKVTCPISLRKPQYKCWHSAVQQSSTKHVSPGTDPERTVLPGPRYTLKFLKILYEVASCSLLLRASYGKAGTEVGYAATRRPKRDSSTSPVPSTKCSRSSYPRYWHISPLRSYACSIKCPVLNARALRKVRS